MKTCATSTTIWTPHSCAVFLYQPQDRPKQYARALKSGRKGDDFDDFRSEYSDILQDQLCEREQRPDEAEIYDLHIEADSLKMARARTAPDRTTFWAISRAWGPPRGDWTPRIGGSHAQHFPPGRGTVSPLTGSGLPRRDFLPRTLSPVLVPLRQCPDVRAGRQIRGGELLQILSPELSDEMLADFSTRKTALW